jgi:sulfite exporter TauE/SafE
MHCKACVFLTESELQDSTVVTKAKTSLATHTVEVTGEFGDKEPSVIAEELSRDLAKHGYTLSTDKPSIKKNWREFRYAVPITIAFVFAFIALQKAGLVSLISGDGVTFGTAFTIGIVASLSTCMAVVGGLVLSMSATFAKAGEKTKPQIMFHAGRIVSFFLLGGVLGAVGSAFRLSDNATLALGLLIGVVMLILGINLLDVFDWAKKLQPSTPKFLSKHALGVRKFNHTFTPLLVGTATFFLPCGFTQSMELYSLGTGSFLAGGLTMLAFALGTFPVLALVSFSSFSVEKSKNRGVFFKTAGLIVILFALFNIASTLIATGLVPPFLNF